MSNEVATRNTAELDTNPATIMGAPSSGMVDLAAWAQELTAAHQIGSALCKTAFVPKDFQGKPDAAAAAILAGKSLGMDPLSALQNIYVIHGRPGLYSRTMHALVMAQGHEVIRTNATPESVTVQARRKGSKDWQEFTWTIQRATTAGYTKSNAKYKENPVEMLSAKAIAEACRVIAPDVLTGIAAYAVEELEDVGERPTPAASAVDRLKAAAQPEPVADVVTGEVQEEIPEDVLAATAKAKADGNLNEYAAWLTEQGAPAHIITYVKEQA